MILYNCSLKTHTGLNSLPFWEMLHQKKKNIGTFPLKIMGLEGRGFLKRNLLSSLFDLPFMYLSDVTVGI